MPQKAVVDCGITGILEQLRGCLCLSKISAYHNGNLFMASAGRKNILYHEAPDTFIQSKMIKCVSQANTPAVLTNNHSQRELNEANCSL